MGELNSIDLTDRPVIVALLIERGRHVTAKQVAKAMGVSERQGYRILARARRWSWASDRELAESMTQRMKG